MTVGKVFRTLKKRVIDLIMDVKSSPSVSFENSMGMRRSCWSMRRTEEMAEIFSVMKPWRWSLLFSIFSWEDVVVVVSAEALKIRRGSVETSLLSKFWFPASL